jgi:hypothetical protein
MPASYRLVPARPYEHEPNARQRGAVLDRRTTAFRAQRTRWRQGSEQGPKGAGNQRSCPSPPGGERLPPLLQPDRFCQAASIAGSGAALPSPGTGALGAPLAAMDTATGTNPTTSPAGSLGMPLEQATPDRQQSAEPSR